MLAIYTAISAFRKRGGRFRVLKYDGIDYMKIKKSEMQKCNVGSLTD
jgi:hypothetical protein